MSTNAGVPLCDVLTQYRRLEKEIQEAVRQVLASGQVILGPEVQLLEEEVARYCGAAHAIGCASGTDALLLALQTLGIGQGDEVLVPDFTFFATIGSVCRTGARPVLVDIDPETYNIDPVQVEKHISPRTRAIIPVHLYGQTAEMEPLCRLAKKHQFYVIEDAAQAIGAEYRGQKTGTLADMACFSFYPSKNLGCCGDGGMVTTSNAAWADYLAALRVHGMKPKYHHKIMGWNSRLDAIQAAILRVKLPYLEEWTLARQKAARRYDELIEKYQLTHLLQRPTTAPRRRHVFNQYVVRVQDGRRDALLRHLQQHQIGCDIYYPIPLHLQECLTYLGYGPGDFPVSEEASRCVLALPMFPEITEQQQRQVMESCAAFVRQSGKMAA